MKKTKKINMAAIGPSKDTSGEILVRKWLEDEDLDVTPNDGSLPGTPDAAIHSLQLAIFVDGRFWHDPQFVEDRAKASRDSARKHGRDMPKIWTNREFWISKARRNQERDRRADAELARMGWKVLHISDDELSNAEGRTEARKKVLSATRVNYKDNFELVYLRHRSLRRARKPSEQELKRYSSHVRSISRRAFNKYKYAFSVLGVDENDVYNVGMCYLIIFIDKWEVKGDDKKSRKVLWQFLNQRFGEWAMIASKKNYNIRGNSDTSQLTPHDFDDIFSGRGRRIPNPLEAVLDKEDQKSRQVLVEKFTRGILASMDAENATEDAVGEARKKADQALSALEEDEAIADRKARTKKLREAFKNMAPAEQARSVLDIACRRVGDPIAREYARTWCRNHGINWEMHAWAWVFENPESYQHYAVVKYDPDWLDTAEAEGLDTTGWPKKKKKKRRSPKGAESEKPNVKDKSAQEQI